jgi:leucyl-tRNA synthetase
VEGVYRFLARAYRAFDAGVDGTAEPSKEQLRLLHATIKKVTTETEELRFNTAIAAMMEFINGVNKWDTRWVLVHNAELGCGVEALFLFLSALLVDCLIQNNAAAAAAAVPWPMDGAHCAA